MAGVSGMADVVAPRGRFARWWDIGLTVGFLGALCAGLGCLLVQVWPGSGSATGVARVLLWRLALTGNARLFLVVACSGALGGVLHSIRSLYWYVGNRSLRSSWLLMYGSLPVVGAVLAVVSYLVLRGGLIATTSATGINPYGIAATSALVGLFSQEASEKLRAVFATLLAPAARGRDQALALGVDGMWPDEGVAGTQVRFRGHGLAAVCRVSFGPVSAAPETVSDTELTAIVPPGAVTGHPVLVAASCVVAVAQVFTVPEGAPGGRVPSGA